MKLRTRLDVFSAAVLSALGASQVIGCLDRSTFGGNRFGCNNPMDLGGGGGAETVDWTTCTNKDTCVLETKSACGTGCEPVPISSFVAINGACDADYRNTGPAPPCVAFLCPDIPAGAANTPNYYAECESGHCQVLDVRTSQLSACGSDSDCEVRSVTSCYGCGSGGLIAVSTQANVDQAFCGASGGCVVVDGPAAYADIIYCASGPLPPGMSVACVAGHCRVAYPVLENGIAGMSGGGGGP
jgi:hypothetical protein